LHKKVDTESKYYTRTKFMNDFAPLVEHIKEKKSEQKRLEKEKEKQEQEVQSECLTSNISSVSSFESSKEEEERHACYFDRKMYNS